MPPRRFKSPLGSDMLNLGTAFWFLAGLAGMIAAGAIVASGRFGRLPVAVEVIIAAMVGWATMFAFAPWRQFTRQRRDRRDIRVLINSLREFDRDRGQHAVRALRTDRDDELGELHCAIHDALATAAAHRMEAQRLRKTMDHSIRRETDRATGRLQRQVVTDPLTGLGNRRALQARIGPLLDTTRRNGHPLSALVIDIDLFKAVNDELGHAAGDSCLAFLGKLLKASLRREDCAFRTGGDEFIVLMPGQPSDVGRKYAERVCSLFNQMSWPYEGPPRPTLSVGVASASAAGTIDPDELLRRADASMYSAKRSGRDRISSYREVA